MLFKAGYDPRRNVKGAPKKQFRRDDFTEELFGESQDDIRLIKNRLIAHALDDKPWAIKLVCEYGFTKPKIREEIENEVRQEIMNTFSSWQRESLDDLKQVFIKQMNKEEVKYEE